jgi:HEAT repeat protein
MESAIAREVWTHLDEILQDLAGSDNPRWRSAAARGLGFVANARARPALEAALADADPDVVASALVSLARQADVATDDAKVARMLTVPDKIVQGDAALCLARLFLARRQQAMPVVAPPERGAKIEADLSALLFDRDDPILRANAAHALGALASPGAEEALLTRLRDDHPFVRLKAAQALSHAGTAKSVDSLLDTLGREPEKNVKTVLALALGAVAERDGRTPPYADLGTDAGRWRQWLAR